MHNYFQESHGWPRRKIITLRQVRNEVDPYGFAAIATLECGHECMLTGTAVHSVDVECKPCGEAQERAKTT